MKFQIFFSILFIIGISCGNPNNLETSKSSKEYLNAQALIRANKADIFKIFDNSTPEVKRISIEFVNLCLNNTEEEFIKKSGKGKDHVRKVINNINFFVDKINEAKAFHPNTEQIRLYNKLKELLQTNNELVNKYLNDNNPNFTQADKQRIRVYKDVLNHDFDGYRNKVIITEKEFEHNFKFITSNWENLKLEMQFYYSPEFQNLKSTITPNG
jgi:hypothetical protein